MGWIIIILVSSIVPVAVSALSDTQGSWVGSWKYGSVFSLTTQQSYGFLLNIQIVWTGLVGMNNRSGDYLQNSVDVQSRANFHLLYHTWWLLPAAWRPWKVYERLMVCCKIVLNLWTVSIAIGSTNIYPVMAGVAQVTQPAA